jgi:hypothetical protein
MRKLTVCVSDIVTKLAVARSLLFTFLINTAVSRARLLLF